MICEKCGQPIPETREGVILTPMKATIYDAIARAKDKGIAPDDLKWLTPALKAHVKQINYLLVGVGGGISFAHGRYMMRCFKVKSPATIRRNRYRDARHENRRGQGQG